MKRAQFAIEFTIVAGVLILVLGGIIAFTSTTKTDARTESDRDEQRVGCEALAAAITTAATLPGISFEITLPAATRVNAENRILQVGNASCAFSTNRVMQDDGDTAFWLSVGDVNVSNDDGMVVLDG